MKEPDILTANTYFWRPGAAAGNRRSNERKHLSTVAEFFRAQGFEVEETGGSVIATKGNLTATFSYSESCNNVYKHLSVERDGRKSNIIAIRKLYEEVSK